MAAIEILNPSFEEPFVLTPEAAAIVGSPTVDLTSPELDGQFTAAFPSEFTDFEVIEVPAWEIYDPEGLFEGEVLPLPGTDIEDLSDLGGFNPSTFSFFSEASDGEVALYVYSVEQPGSTETGFGVRQVLDTGLEAKTQYRLSVDVGDPLVDPTFPLDGFPGYQIEILAGGNLLAIDSNSIAIEEGTFQTVELTFTTFETHPNLGENLEIRLVNPALDLGIEVEFDNVRLEAVKPPFGSVQFGFFGQDLLTAGTGDRLFGGIGNDTLDASAGGGSNRLFGGLGRDTLIAGSSDRLSGGLGRDEFFFAGGNNLAIGGRGADRFHLAADSLPRVANIIKDFGLGNDKLVLGSELGLDFADIELTKSGSDTIVGASGRSLAILLNVDTSDLSASDFLFA